MVANKESKLDGIAFNPFTHNLIFKRPLVEKIEAVEKARKEGSKRKSPPQSTNTKQTATANGVRFHLILKAAQQRSSILPIGIR